jgi:hypothetical protein
MISLHTKISTPYFQLQEIKWFAQEKPGERFLVYCWNPDKEDFTLDWAYDAQKITVSKTIRIKLDNGTSFIATPDQQVLLKNKTWIPVEKICFGETLMAFNKLKPSIFFNQDLKYKQFPRIYTHTHGWKTERQFIDEWRTGKVEEIDKKIYTITRLLVEGVTLVNVYSAFGYNYQILKRKINKAGFSLKELRHLGKETDYRRVIGIEPWKEIDVYSLYTDKYQNFCGQSFIFNCLNK